MQLSQKEKALPVFFSSFLKYTLKLEPFRKKLTLIADVFLKFFTPKNMVRSMPKNSRLGGCVEKKHGKCTQTFFNYEGQLLYYIY